MEYFDNLRAYSKCSFRKFTNLISENIDISSSEYYPLSSVIFFIIHCKK